MVALLGHHFIVAFLFGDFEAQFFWNSIRILRPQGRTKLKKKTQTEIQHRIFRVDIGLIPAGPAVIITTSRGRSVHESALTQKHAMHHAELGLMHSIKPQPKQDKIQNVKFEFATT